MTCEYSEYGNQKILIIFWWAKGTKEIFVVIECWNATVFPCKVLAQG